MLFLVLACFNFERYTFNWMRGFALLESVFARSGGGRSFELWCLCTLGCGIPGIAHLDAPMGIPTIEPLGSHSDMWNSAMINQEASLGFRPALCC